MLLVSQYLFLKYFYIKIFPHKKLFTIILIKFIVVLYPNDTTEKDMIFREKKKRKNKSEVE